MFMKMWFSLEYKHVVISCANWMIFTSVMQVQKNFAQSDDHRLIGFLEKQF